MDYFQGMISLKPFGPFCNFTQAPIDSCAVVKLSVWFQNGNGRQVARSQRHSDPSAFQQWPALIGGRLLERIESSEELPSMSSSADNLPLLRNSRNSRNRNWRPKPVLPPRIRCGKTPDTSWAVDSSWEFIGEP